MDSAPDQFDWLNGSAKEAAKRLLGCELVRELDGQTLRAKIIEVEAYDQTDPASHSFRGETPRTAPMFGPGGRAYVYFTYGMYHCMNIVVGEPGYGAAVLIRAIEPIEGEDVMELRRHKTGIELTNGPGKLCIALGIDRSLSGHDLSTPPLQLVKHDPIPPVDIVTGTRIGISQAVDELRRFYIRSNPYVSKPHVEK